jgi:hypothetical protein
MKGIRGSETRSRRLPPSFTSDLVAFKNSLKFVENIVDANALKHLLA